MKTIPELLASALGDTLTLTPEGRTRMARGAADLDAFLATGRPVYGITSGFGPLVRHRADADRAEQGRGLIQHLCVGQGPPLGQLETRLMIWLRLAGMRIGYSAIDVADWSRLAELFNRGFAPLVPSEGSVSASGDLIPLAHAALAMAGTGRVWPGRDAATRLHELGIQPIAWNARSALGFVNGTSAALAVTLLNHARIAVLARALAALTGRIVLLLRASPEAYDPALQRARNQPGQCTAAGWIRVELDRDAAAPQARTAQERPLQEPYSLRCAPQVIGAVLDQLELQERVLLDEAAGVTDNPVVTAGGVLHGGNFHAAPVGLASDVALQCAHQLAYLAERQLALVVDPARNGGLPPLLAARPGATSGLAGLQIAATSHLGRIRQLGYPASMTPVPTNLHNQDHVPMALNGANACTEAVRYLALIAGSLGVAVAQLESHLPGRAAGGRVWDALHAVSPPLRQDRPLSAEIRAAARTLTGAFGTGVELFTYLEEANAWC